MQNLNVFSLTLALALALAGVSMATAIQDITFAHFASHEANLATAEVDLTPWGYYGGQLPKSYTINGNGSYNYIPTDSYLLFQKITAGQHNRTAAGPNEASISGEITPEEGVEKRQCQPMTFDLYGYLSDGESCTTSFNSNCINPSNCYYGAGCGNWNSINVYFNGDSFITLWTSTSCNGNQESFNPICGWSQTQNCGFDFLVSSFGTKTPCHSQFSSNCV